MQVRLCKLYLALLLGEVLAVDLLSVVAFLHGDSLADVMRNLLGNISAVLDGNISADRSRNILAALLSNRSALLLGNALAILSRGDAALLNGDVLAVSEKMSPD